MKAAVRALITEYEAGGDSAVLQRRITDLINKFGVMVELINGRYTITSGSASGTTLRDLVGMYHDGGIIGSGVSSKTVDIVNQLLNTKPNERVVKALVGELYAPAENITKKFVPNLQTALDSIQPVGLIASGGNSYELNMNIESMNGTKKDAQAVFKEVIKGFRAMGGGV